MIREIQETLMCVGKRKELITKNPAQKTCWWSKSGLALNAKHITRKSKKVACEICAGQDIIVNIIMNNILVQRGLVSQEQKWEDRKTVRTPRDEITVGTEHVRSEEWANKGRVAGSRLKPDLAWLRRDAGGEWTKVVADVKVTSTEDMEKAFKEKDEKYREWATRDTREMKAAKVPIIISHDGAIHRDSVRRWKNFAPDIKVDWVRMAQNVLRYNVVIVGRFFNKGSWVSEAWKKNHPEGFEEEPEGAPERVATAAERREMLRFDTDPVSTVGVRSRGTPPPHSVRLTSAGR